MKELDKTKKYDLSKLTDEQLEELCKNIGYSIKLNNGCSLYYSSHFRHWIMTTMPFGDDLEKACATELFEDEKEYSVGQPYNKEKLLNNKTMTEEEKELIYLFKNLSDYKDYKFKVQYSLIELEKELYFTKGKKRKLNIYKEFIQRLKM